MAFDWLTASHAARAELYRSCKRVVDGYFVGNWGKFYAAVFDGSGTFGQGYEDNFRKGMIARPKAAQLARWLSIHHTREAELLAQRVAQLASEQALGWEAYLAQSARDDALSLISMASLGIVGFARSTDSPLPRFRLGEEFCLRLNAEAEGSALGFQRVRGHWYPLRLADDRLEADIAFGETVLPRSTTTGEILPLSDDEDGGRILFVLIVADQEFIATMATNLTAQQVIPPATLDQIAEQLVAVPHSVAHRAEVVIS